MSVSGSPCPKCGAGQMKIRSSYSSGEWHTRYLKCTHCDHKDQQVIRAEMVHRRQR